MRQKFILSLMLFVCCILATAANKEKRAIEQFTQIEVSKGANISLVQCDTLYLEVVTDGCPTSDVETYVKKGILYVRMAKRTAGSAVQVFIYFSDVERIDVKTGASVETDCHFEHRGSAFTLAVGAKCEAEMDIDVDELVVDANSCTIELEGIAKKQTVDFAGTVGEAKYDASSLESEDVEINVSGAEATVKFSKSLIAKAVGGTIKYIGDESNVKAETSLGGKVEKD